MFRSFRFTIGITMAFSSYTAELTSWQDALSALQQGVKSYRIGSRDLTYRDIKEIRDTIDWLEAKVNAASGGS